MVQAVRDLPLRLNPPASFSQHGEDRFILESVLAGRTAKGIYVDIGASHPARLSNTYLFYLKGWRGIVVEPIASLMKLHKIWRPRDTHVQCLVGNSVGDAEFHQLFPSVLSTTSKSDLEEQLGNGAVLLKTTLLPQLTLEALFDKYVEAGPIDFLSIDVEGIDQLIAGQVVALPFHRRPFALCIEAKSDGVESELVSILGPAYKQSRKMACNLIFWGPVDG